MRMYRAVSLRVAAITTHRHKHMGEFHKCSQVPHLALHNLHSGIHKYFQLERTTIYVR